jgi:DNA-binding transcriptional regulator LsrR (DeoR family)
MRRRQVGPAELIQATAIARAYYLEGMAKTDIAVSHGLSRYKVARILDACLAEGIVRIEIASPGLVDTELSEGLRRAYGLRHAIVVTEASADIGSLRAALGRAAAGLLTEMITEEDVLGVAWGRSLDAMARQVDELPPCQIVQLTGIAGAVRASSVDLIRQLSAVSHGLHFPVYAPLVVSDAATASALRRQPGIEAAVSRWKSVSVAMVAVGSWDEEGSQLYPVLTDADRQALTGLGVVSEMCSILFDDDGRPLSSLLSERSIAIPYADLVRIPEVIAVAGGVAKTDAIGSVLRGRAVTAVVTDADVARRLLAREPRLLATKTTRRKRLAKVG